MRSKFENKFAENLEKRGIRFEYESETFEYWIKLPRARCLECCGCEIVTSREYTPDFYLPGWNIYLETKGKWTADDRKKHKAMKEQYPELDIRLLFMSDNKISRNSKTRYSDWCEKNGIKYMVIGRGAKVPSEEWLNGVD